MSDLPIANYASTRRNPPRRPLAVAVLFCVLGCVFIFFGGCFLIGILIGATWSSPLNAWQRDHLDILIFSLYVLAAGAFGLAAMFLVKGVRSLPWDET